MYIRVEDIQEDHARNELVGKINDRIKSHKALHKKAFERMRDSQRQVRCGATKHWRKNSYVVNVTQRMVKQKVSQLYARNPRMAAKRREKLWYAFWDGNPVTLQNAVIAVEAAKQEGMEPPQEQLAILEEYDAVQRAQEQLDRVGQTMQTLFHYYVDEQDPPFKTQMKQCVRRAVTNTVAYVKLGFQREMGKPPNVAEQINDFRERLAYLERIAQDVEEGDTDEDSAEAEMLRQSLKALEQEEEVIIREGLVFSFPRSTDIIPDDTCRQLSGFVGCNMLTHQMFLTRDQITEIYGVKLEAADFNQYQVYEGKNGRDWQPESSKETKEPRDSFGCVWETYHKPSGLMLTTLDGYKDFLEEPRSPNVMVDNFFPVYALSFTQQEDENELFPPSDVELITDQQMEMNRAREARRQHRIAARPGWAAASGALEDAEKDALRDRQNMSVIELANLAPGQNVQDLFQAIPMPGVDPSLYETATTFDDIQLAAGAQEATLGGLSGATATETSISEASRATTISDNEDDMNDFLKVIARGAGQILLRETSVEEANRIAGPGAVWPELSDQEIQEELFLDLAAGSKGPPNQGAQIATMERVLPLILQIPGFNPDWLRRMTARIVDDTFDAQEAFEPTAPSIMAMNDTRQPSTGNPQSDPNQQGGQGGSAQQAPGSQAGPAPGSPQVVAGTDVR